MKRSVVPFLMGAFFAAAIADSVASQCTTHWATVSPLAGANGPVNVVIEWDPDGPGPQWPVLVVGGNFLAAGGSACNYIATYDPATQQWAPLGVGMNGPVYALAVLPNGQLIAGGQFGTAGGVPASRIARWNGSTWAALGSGMSGFNVASLTVRQNGDLIAAGDFSHAGGAWVNHIAKWNGAAWSSLGQGGLDDRATAVVTLPNGDVVVGGQFTTAGGVAANRIARWDGATWSTLGAGAAFVVTRVLALPNGDVVAAAAFTAPGQIQVGRWDGTSWTMLGPVLGNLSALTHLPNGDIVAAGPSIDIVRWNGASWSVLGDTPAGYGANALAVLQNGNLVAGGDLRDVSGVVTDSIATWNGTNWLPVSPIAGRLAVTALTALPAGDLVAGVEVRRPNSAVGRRVEQWNGSTWTPLGGDFDGPVHWLLQRSNGDVVAAGAFTAVGGAARNGIARWDGQTWGALGAGIGGVGHALLELPNGDLLAGGAFGSAPPGVGNRVARWNGTGWSDYGAGLPAAGSYAVRSLAMLPNGDVVAGTDIHGVYRRNGAIWSPVGTMTGSVYALAVRPNGDLIAGGPSALLVNGIPLQFLARWNGLAWSSIHGNVAWSPGSTIVGLAALPGGDVIATGTFTSIGTAAAANVARWNGSTWQAPALFAMGTLGPIAVHPDGDVLIGGTTTFVSGSTTRLGEAVSDRIVRLTTTCPATATASGAGCTGSGGPNVLTATALPWSGSTYRAVATGLPANSLALAVYGASTVSIALPSILPQGAPGCTLLVSPDALEVAPASNGAAPTQVVIPAAASIWGLVLQQQVVALDLDAMSNIVSVTSSNRLTLTIGAF